MEDDVFRERRSLQRFCQNAALFRVGVYQRATFILRKYGIDVPYYQVAHQLNLFLQAQYKFIYECLLEATVCGVTEISVQEFKKKFETLCDVDPRTKRGGIVREFTVRILCIAVVESFPSWWCHLKASIHGAFIID